MSVWAIGHRSHYGKIVTLVCYQRMGKKGSQRIFVIFDTLAFARFSSHFRPRPNTKSFRMQSVVRIPSLSSRQEIQSRL